MKLHPATLLREVDMRTRLLIVTALAAAGGAAALACLTQCAAQGEIVTGNLLQGLKTDQPGYALGEKVTFAYGLRNKGDEPIKFTFRSSKQYDLWIERAGKEVYRLSKGKVYLTVITSLTLEPGQTKTFDITWNQKDNKGQQVGPGTYTAHVQLTPMRKGPPAVTTKVEIGTTSAALIPVTVKEAITRVNELANRRVVITGIYRGWQPDPDDPNCKPGPPVTRSDWVIADHTGCMYVTGPVKLDPTKDLGTRITVTGKLRKTGRGQVYLVLDSATIQRQVAPQ